MSLPRRIALHLSLFLLLGGRHLHGASEANETAVHSGKTEGALHPTAHLSSASRGVVSILGSIAELLFTDEQLAEINADYETFARDKQRNMSLLALTFGAIALLSIVGNSLVLVFCVKNNSQTNAYLFSLAVSDLTMTIVNIPASFLLLTNLNWPVSNILCLPVNFIKYLVVYNSSYTMVAIAWHRYQVICNSWQLKTGPQSTFARRFLLLGSCKKRAHGLSRPKTHNWCVFFVIWGLSAFFSLLFTYNSSLIVKMSPQGVFILGQSTMQIEHNNLTMTDMELIDLLAKYFDTNDLFSSRCNILTSSFTIFLQTLLFPSLRAEIIETNVVFLTQLFIPLVITAYLYVRIGVTIYKQSKTIFSQDNAKLLLKAKQQRRRIVMLSVVLLMFAGSWLPLHIYFIFTESKIIGFDSTVYSIVYCVAMCSSFFNSLIYWVFNRDFNSFVKSVCLWCWCQAPTEPLTAPNMPPSGLSGVNVTTDRRNLSDTTKFNGEVGCTSIRRSSRQVDLTIATECQPLKGETAV